MNPTGADSFLLQAFRDFYAVLSRTCSGVREGPWIASNRAGEDDSVAELRQARVASIRSSLLDILDSLDREAHRMVGDLGMATFREVKYVMVALADELLLAIDWEGRDLWGADLLESHVFDTHLAGERFFTRAHEILGLPREDGVDLATVYLLALSLGFQGRYRGHKDPQPVKELRRKLLAFVSPGDRSPFDPKRRLFPQAHAHTLEQSADLRLPPVGRWVSVLVASLVLWGAVSHLVWKGASRELGVVQDSLTMVLCSARSDDQGGRAHPKCPQGEMAP